MTRIALILSTIAIALVGCKDKTKPFKYGAVKKSEAEVARKELALALKSCTRASMSRVVDTEGMARLAARGFKKDVRETLVEGVGAFNPADLCRGTGAVGKPKHLRTIATGEHPKLLFRVLGKEGELNYLEFTIGKRDNRVVAFDLYSYSAGRRMSEIFHDLMKSISGDLSGLGAKLNQASMLMKAGQRERAIGVIKSMPAKVRNSAVVMLFELRLHAAGDEKEYLDAIERFRKTHPNNPAADLLNIDRALLKKKFKEALAAIDRLDKQVGGDPYLDMIRAISYMQLNDHAEASKRLRHVISKEPDLVPAELKTWLKAQSATPTKPAAPTKPAQPATPAQPAK